MTSREVPARPASDGARVKQLQAEHVCVWGAQGWNKRGQQEAVDQERGHGLGRSLTLRKEVCVGSSLELHSTW